MTSYVAIQSHQQSTDASYLQDALYHVKAWLAVYRVGRARRRTEKLFARLDRSILEDIGIPHDHVSLRAGALNRYPHVITVKSPSF